MEWVVHCGDALETLKTLQSASVQCCVTSPPYFGLRDYGTAAWEGGDLHCDHSTSRSRGEDIRSGDKQGTSAGSRPNTQSVCRCGAARVDKQLGLESTPEEYVSRLVAIFNEVRRLLKSDGTLWLNLGDSYYGSGRGPAGYNGLGNHTTRQGFDTPSLSSHDTLKPKDLIGIPWMVAFALRAEGWYLRSDIVWAKSNCMPESVTDRPTRSHEYIFLLSKSARYYYDHEAIKEPAVYDVDGTGTASRKARAYGSLKSYPTDERAGIRAAGFKDASQMNGKNGDKQRGHSRRHAGFNDRWDAMSKEEQCTGMRNKRDVWTVAPAQYREAHFATFPPALIKSCVLAGCPEGGTVLDPFAGSGTVGEVALKFGRKAVLIELNPNYIPLIKARCVSPTPLFD